jgi:predicted nucleic acid-binding protein
LSALYLDTSAVLRVLLETGTTPEFERRLHAAKVLITSRLARVEAARALLRLRLLGNVSPARLDEAARAVQDLWDRCNLWELTPAVCELAAGIAPDTALRTLDALHLATFVLARHEISDLALLTADHRLAEAAESV